jgi:hypothetical protein
MDHRYSILEAQRALGQIVDPVCEVAKKYEETAVVALRYGGNARGAFRRTGALVR